MFLFEKYLCKQKFYKKNSPNYNFFIFTDNTMGGQNVNG